MSGRHLYEEVEMPSKGISINRSASKGTPYVYHIGKGYRNQYGKPTSKKELIGKLNEKTQKLIPNDRYFEIYDGTAMEQQQLRRDIHSVKDFGSYYLLDAIAHQYQLDKILKNIFGDISENLLLLAIYTVLEGNVYDYFEDWRESTHLFYESKLTSQTISKLLSEITEEKKREFFKAWMYARKQHEYIAYDVTSISSYSRLNPNIEYGYNRDHEALAQINLGMFFGEESRLPLYYSVYPGSIPDKSHLKYMMRDTKKMGMKKVKYVMDCGFFSAANIDLLVEEGYSFVIGVPSHLKQCVKLRQENASTIKSAKYHLAGTALQAFCVKDTTYRHPIMLHMYYSSEKAAREEALFYKQLQEMEEALRDGENPIGNERYFLCETTQDGAIHVERIFSAIDEKLNEIGYFFLASSEPALSSEQALQIYRSKDLIEKNFDNLKNEIDMKRLRVHSLRAMEGKMFVAFLALILRSHVFNATVDYRAKERLCIEKIFMELRKIKVVNISGISILHPLTRKQKEILSLFSCSEDDILRCI